MESLLFWMINVLDDFLLFYFSNPRVPCHSLPYLDLSHWREKVTQCRVNGLDIELGSSKKISPCTSCTCTKEGVIFSDTFLKPHQIIHSAVVVLSITKKILGFYIKQININKSNDQNSVENAIWIFYFLTNFWVLL